MYHNSAAYRISTTCRKHLYRCCAALHHAGSSSCNNESCITKALSHSTLSPLKDHKPIMADHPPPYSSVEAPPTPYISSNELYNSSTASLGPNAVPSDGRRKLLLVYIHGFMGNETSFQSFPAHVHNMVTALLSESHTVHSKIYPRYRSKKSIQEAAASFGAWYARYSEDIHDGTG